MTINKYKENILNAEKVAKENGLDLELYDFNFIDKTAYNCEFVLREDCKTKAISNGKSFINPYTNKEQKMVISYLQLSCNCSSVCMARYMPIEENEVSKDE